MNEAIPTYSEATSTSPPPPPPSHSAPPSPRSTTLPPAYAVLDATQTTFSLHGTFIHTPSTPAYQISSPLTTHGPYFRIRRLQRTELQAFQSQSVNPSPNPSSSPIVFDKESILYEVNDPPLLDNEWHIIGKRRGCVRGVLVLKWRRGKWRVLQVLERGGKGVEIVSFKPSPSPSPSSLSSSSKTQPEPPPPYTYYSAAKDVLASESFHVRGDGSVVPKLEVRQGLEGQWREMLITVWVTRLWVACG
ncbi:hypothetical protein CC80DRAFT_454316, partial [Byssothecium circinans]